MKLRSSSLPVGSDWLLLRPKGRGLGSRRRRVIVGRFVCIDVIVGAVVIVVLAFSVVFVGVVVVIVAVAVVGGVAVDVGGVSCFCIVDVLHVGCAQCVLRVLCSNVWWRCLRCLSRCWRTVVCSVWCVCLLLLVFVVY